MKKTLIAAAAVMLAFSACAKSEGEPAESILTDSISQTQQMTETSEAAQTTPPAEAEVTAETTAETVTEPPVSQELLDFDIDKLSREQRGMLNGRLYSYDDNSAKKIIEGDRSVTILWDRDPSGTYVCTYNTTMESDNENTEIEVPSEGPIEINGLENGLSYYFSIKNTALEEPDWENSFWMTAVPTSVSKIESIREVSNTDGKISLEWDAAENANAYLVYKDGSENYGELMDIVFSCYYEIDSLASGSRETIKVIPARIENGDIDAAEASALEIVVSPADGCAGVEYVYSNDDAYYNDMMIFGRTMDYPVITLSDADVSEKINSYVYEFMKGYENSLIGPLETEEERAAYYESEKDGFAAFSGYSHVTGNIIVNTENMLTAAVTADLYSAGAVHGIDYVLFLNFDPTTGELLRFDNIFDKEKFLADCHDAIDEYDVWKYVNDEGDDSTTELFTDPSDADPDALNWRDLHWYYKDSVMVFLTDVYQFDSYAAGHIRIPLSYEQIKASVIRKDIIS